MILRKERAGLGHYYAHSGKAILISSYAKKIWSGERTCACANSIKNCFIVLVSSPHQLPLKTCLRSGKRKLKAMLFYLMWIPSIFDSFDDHSSVHRSSGRLIPIHSFREKKYHYGVVWFYGLNFRLCHIKKILLFKNIK